MLRLVRVILPILIVFTISAAFAQEGPQGRWWRTPKIAKALNLTQGEIRQLDSAWENSRAKQIKLKGEVEAEQFRLQTLLEKQNLNEKAVREQNRKLETARSRLADERTVFVVSVRKIIGHARFQQLVNMR